MKPSRKLLLAIVTAVIAVGLLGGAPAQAATSTGTVSIAQNFTWGTGNRDCVSPPADYVVCIFASATVPGLGTLDYARYAQNAAGLTKDGCGRLSTHGTIWVAGGTAEVDGQPASTCGKGTGLGRPDAHYLYTILKGTGVLEGATGSGDIVADHGTDIWKGTLVAPRLKGMTVPLASAAPSPSTVTASTGPAATPTPATSPGAASQSAASPGVATSPTASIATAAVASNPSSSRSSAAAWLALSLLALAAIAIGVALSRRRAAAGGNS